MDSLPVNFSNIAQVFFRCQWSAYNVLDKGFCLWLEDWFEVGGSSNGRTTDSDSVNLGSNPGPSAKWSHRLVVRTLASHAGNRGSTPLGTTK